MSNAVNFVNSYANNIAQLVGLFNSLETQNQQMTDDPTLVERYFASTTPLPRSDINAQDIANAQSAIVQILFAFNSGTPTQASFLHKMMP